MKKFILLITVMTMLLLVACSSSEEAAVEKEEYIPIELGEVEIGKLGSEGEFKGTVSPGEVTLMPLISRQKVVDYKAEAVTGDKVYEDTLLALYTTDEDEEATEEFLSTAEGTVIGHSLQDGALIYQLMDLEEVEVVFYLQTEKFDDVEIGDEVEVIKAKGDVFTGTITDKAITPDPMKNMYKVTLETESKGKLLPGNTVDIIKEQEEKNKFLIPIDAVLYDGKDAYVYTYADEKITRVDIETGSDNGEVVEVIRGLLGNEKIVIKGQGFIDEGSVVKVVR